MTSRHRNNPKAVAPTFLTVPEAAPHIPCAPASLATPQWRRKWKIPCYRIGARVLFDLKEIVAWRALQRTTYDPKANRR
jgi:hypothetical protein